jgi:hypothetical protein
MYNEPEKQAAPRLARLAFIGKNVVALKGIA